MGLLAIMRVQYLKVFLMEIYTQIIEIISSKLKNPIYQTMQLLNIKTILSKSNFSKKEGVEVYMVVLHFVYMLIMNKKLSSFMEQSKDSFKKDVYYRVLANTSYNWRKLLSLSSIKMISLLHKVQDIKAIKVLILDDTIEGKVGKEIEGSCDKLYSNKEKRTIRGVNVVSLNYSDGFSNFMLDFAIAMNKYARVKVEKFKNKVDHRSSAYKRRIETLKGKQQIAIEMIKRAVKSGIYADYLLVDSWYSKPIFLAEMNTLGLRVISRIANNNKIWNFIGKHKTLNGLYNAFKDIKKSKRGEYGKKIKFTYFSIIVEHKTAGKLKIVFIKTQNKLIPIVSTDLALTDDEIIEIYKRRWDIEQGYKELREYFGFGKEENRIYEALIARITLSFFTYNIVSYINRISNEPKTIGGLFKDLECELYTLAIAMQTFILILDEIAKVEELVKRNEDLLSIIEILQDVTQKMLGFRCES